MSNSSMYFKNVVYVNFCKIILLLFLLLAFLFIVGYQEGNCSEQNYNFVYASFSAPDAIANQSVRAFKEEIERLTDGQITMEMFYSGELYNQKATYTAIRRGDLDMAWIGFDFYEQQLPYLSMFTSAYFFKNNEHFEKVWTGDIGERVFKDMYEKVGVRPLYVGMVGARNVTLRDIGREVRTPYDMKGVMLRVPDSPSFLLMGKALGANPTPLNYGEVYMALQTGTIDGQENPISHILDAKFYEPSKYLILTEHVQTFSGLAINSKKWDIIGPELQKKMLLASEVAFNRCKQISIENEEKGIKIMKEDGLIIINPDKDSFKEYAEKVYKSNQEFTKDWDWDLYEEVKTLVQ